MDISVRPFDPADRAAIFDITLKTGDASRDATALHNHPTLLGDIWSVPYTIRHPELCFVAVFEAEVIGYVVGTPDTTAFESWQGADWWPAMQGKYPHPSAASLTDNDRNLIEFIHAPQRTPDFITSRFPAHMHMNGLPAMRGQGIGRHLFDRWIEAARGLGVQSVHIGADATNTGGIAFWSACGFRPIPLPPASTITAMMMGQSLTSSQE